MTKTRTPRTPRVRELKTSDWNELLNSCRRYLRYCCSLSAALAFASMVWAGAAWTATRQAACLPLTLLGLYLT